MVFHTVKHTRRRRYRMGLLCRPSAPVSRFFAPYSGTSAHMWRNPEYYVNQLNFADTAGALAAGGKSESGYVSDAIAQLGEVDVEVPGEYVITFESVSAGDKQIFVSSIILDGTAQDAVLQSVSVDCAKPGLLVGQSAPLSVTAHLSDGSLITGTPPSVSLLGRSITMNAESLSPNIFSVDGTGMLTALAPGEGQVKGGASMGGVSLYSTIQISAAKAPIYSGYIETYSFKYNAYAGDTGFWTRVLRLIRIIPRPVRGHMWRTRCPRARVDLEEICLAHICRVTVLRLAEKPMVVFQMIG